MYLLYYKTGFKSSVFNGFIAVQQTLNKIVEPCVDSNVIRIISRYYGIYVKNDNRIDTIIGSILKNIAPFDRFRDFNYALLDLGGIVCLPQKPNCFNCPIQKGCFYYLVKQ
jgi:A/G-specific adenine glycosylase